MTLTIMIAGMAAITFGIRAALFVLGDRVVFPASLRSALDYVPVAVLTAIIVPMILSPGGEGLELTWENPRLVASAVAVAVCLATGMQLVTIVAALAVFFGWQFLLPG